MRRSVASISEAEGRGGRAPPGSRLMTDQEHGDEPAVPAVRVEGRQSEAHSSFASNAAMRRASLSEP